MPLFTIHSFDRDYRAWVDTEEREFEDLKSAQAWCDAHRGGIEYHVDGKHLPPAPTISDYKHQRNLLGEALGKVLVAAGMIRADADMTGPELLLAAEDFCRAPNGEWSEVRLAVQEPVARDDGRFYVPVTWTHTRTEGAYYPLLSPVVLRIASDAFFDDRRPSRFAEALVATWNAAHGRPD